MSSSINWMGNKVVEGRAPAQMPARQPRPVPPIPDLPSYLPDPPARMPMDPSARMPMDPSARMPMDPSARMPMDPPARMMMDPPATMPVDQPPPATIQGPPPSTEPGFIPNYLLINIGRSARCEFIIGTNQYVDKTGIISQVGINYFVLYDPNSQSDIMCDLYSVKFVTIHRG